MSLGQLWATLRAARWSIILMTIVATAVAGILASTLPKQYTAKARVMVNIYNNDPNQFSALKRNTEDAYLGTEMRLVTDAAVTRDVATRLGWPDNPQVITAWQAATGGAGDVASWAGAQIGSGIGVQRLEDSAILEIYYSSTSLEAAKQIAALIRTAYIDQSLKFRAEAARRAAAWNRTQAAKALVALRAAEAARIAFMSANQISLDTPLGGLDWQLHANALQMTVGHLPKTLAARGDDAVVFGLKRQLSQIDMALALPSTRGEQNPGVIAMRLQRDNIARQLEREQSVALAGPNATSAQIGMIRQQRDADYLKARLNLLSRAPLYDHLALLDRDVQMKTQRYDTAARHVADFDTVAAAPSGLRILGDVIADDAPSFPNIPLMMAIAAGASFALSCAWTIVGDLVRRRLRSAEDLRFFAGVPVLAVIADDPRPAAWRAGLARLTRRFARRRPTFAPQPAE